MIWRVVTLECIIVNLKYKCLPNEVQQFVNLLNDISHIGTFFIGELNKSSTSQFTISIIVIPGQILELWTKYLSKRSTHNFPGLWHISTDSSFVNTTLIHLSRLSCVLAEQHVFQFYLWGMWKDDISHEFPPRC